MNSILPLLDCILIVTLLCLAWQALNSENIFKAVVLFMSFGLLMAIAWVRMKAPDIALAEAALGAGLTGPIFLATLSRMEQLQKYDRRLDEEAERGKEDENSASYQKKD